MKASILSIAALASVAMAELDAEQVESLTVLFSDIENNINQYLSYLSSNSDVTFPTNLIGIFKSIATYTDDSYTTILAALPDSEYEQIQSLETALPWYTSRIEPKITVAASSSAAASSSEAATTAAETTAATTAAASSSEAASSTLAVSEASSSAASIALSTFSAGAAANAPYAGLGLGAMLGYMLL
ncbi:hypothetical protein HII13_003555 [Brettanomyces bruxellensis]|nr:hypothetical protein HII13_003555 [Brettanomyces bruxellensis]